MKNETMIKMIHMVLDDYLDTLKSW